MIVELIAHTVIVPDAIARMGYRFHDNGSTPGDELAEVAGRECYQSWGRPNPGTATNAGYLANIINKNHFSVMEHASYTFSIREVSRSLTHELVRHRHLSPSMLSQRYVDESHGDFIVPADIANGSALPDLLMTDFHHDAIELYNKICALLIESGVPRKRVRQAARSVLPNGHATRLVLTGNIRAWREMLSKRLAVDPINGEPLADLEIYELASKILEQLHVVAPNSVQDLYELHRFPARTVTPDRCDCGKFVTRDKAINVICSCGKSFAPSPGNPVAAPGEGVLA